MGWSYNKLWFMLIERDMNRVDLIKFAGINSNALTHMSKKEPVTMTALGKICQAFHCRLEDIVEYIPEPETDEEEKNCEE